VVLRVELPTDERAAVLQRRDAGRTRAGKRVQDRLAAVREVANERLHQAERLHGLVQVRLSLHRITEKGPYAAFPPGVPSRAAGRIRVRDYDRFVAHARPIARKLWLSVRLDPDTRPHIASATGLESCAPCHGCLDLAEYNDPSPRHARNMDG